MTLNVSGMTFQQALAKGLDVRFMAAAGFLSDALFIHKFGENPAVGAATETVWDAGGLYPWQDQGSGLTMTLQSTSAADDVAGTGVRYVTISYISNLYELKTVIVETDGLTPVAVADDIYLPYRMDVQPGPNGEAAAGSGGTATGIITLENAATVYAQILVGNNQTLMGVFTIPAGFTAYLLVGDATVGEGKEVHIDFSVREFNGVFRIQHSLFLFENAYRYDFTGPLPIQEKSDLDIMAIDAALNPSVSATFDLILVQNKE